MWRVTFAFFIMRMRGRHLFLYLVYTIIYRMKSDKDIRTLRSEKLEGYMESFVAHKVILIPLDRLTKDA